MQNIFRWEDRNIWMNGIITSHPSLFGSRVAKALCALNPAVSDDAILESLKTLISPNNPNLADAIWNEVKSSISRQFEAVIWYHGGRFECIEAILDQGLQRADTGRLLERAKVIFGAHPRLHEVAGELAAYATNSHGLIWLALTKLELLQVNRHYLRAGSEYLQAIAGRLDLMSILESFGVPCIVECLIANEPGKNDGWVDLLLKACVRKRIGYPTRPNICYCYKSTKDIDADHIVGVYECKESIKPYSCNDPNGLEKPGTTQGYYLSSFSKGLATRRLG